MIIDNASPIEIVYTLAMVCTLGVACSSWAWAAARVRELERVDENGPILVLRKGARNDQARIVALSACLVVIGIVSVFSPPYPGDVTAPAIVSGAAFLVLSVVVAWLSIAIRLRPAQIWTSARKHIREGL